MRVYSTAVAAWKAAFVAEALEECDRRARAEGLVTVEWLLSATPEELAEWIDG